MVLSQPYTKGSGAIKHLASTMSGFVGAGGSLDAMARCDMTLISIKEGSWGTQQKASTYDRLCRGRGANAKLV